MKDFIIKKIYSIMTGMTGFIILFLIWAWFSRGYSSLIVPSPRETFMAVKKLFQSGVLLENILITVKRTVVGFGLAVLFGIISALLLNKNDIIRSILRPIITVIQTTPPVVWLALAVIWFGIADNITPIFLIFIVTFPIIFINIFEGLQNLNKNLIKMAEVYKATRKQIYLDIYFPSLITYLVSSLSVGLAFAWKSSIFAEFIGSNSGIGYALSVANSNLNTPQLFAWSIILVGLMLAVEYIILKPLQKKVSGWQQYE